MKRIIIIFITLAYILVSCQNDHTHDEHDEQTEHHENEKDHEHEESEEHHEHEESHEHAENEESHEQDEHSTQENEENHEHEDIKTQFTAYSNEFEVFAEADPFVLGKTAHILAHFSHLPSFKAIEKGSITIKLIINGKESNQILNKPLRKGIYRFEIKPNTVGKGEIVFDIKTKNGDFQILVPNMRVFDDEHEAIHETEEAVHEAEEAASVNTTVFTKEQSWKIDFATEKPKIEPFGQIIKTTAQIQSAQADEILVSAKTSGIVKLSNNNVLEGKSVSKGQIIFSISASGLAENNSTVLFLEAQNNFEKAKSDYKRIKELAKDKIISEKELLNAKNQYNNTKAIFDNMKRNFTSSGQNITSPMKGFVKQLFVQNGQYIEAGQPIVSISKNKTLILRADVQQKYASILGTISSANIRSLHNDKSYSFEELNGKILSYGRSTNSENYLIPLNVQIDNIGSFIAGGFVELFLKTRTNYQALTIPNSALLEEQGVYFVFVQITPELFEKRAVKPLVSDGIRSEIAKGISKDERIVSKGAIFIKLAQASGALDAHSGHVH